MPCTMYMWGAFIVLSSYPQTEVATAVMLEEAVCGDGHHCMELKSICWKSYTFPTTNHGKLSSKTIFPPQTDTHKCQNGIYPGSDKNIHIFLSVFLLLLFSEHIAMRINTNATYKHAHTHKKNNNCSNYTCMWERVCGGTLRANGKKDDQCWRIRFGCIQRFMRPSQTYKICTYQHWAVKEMLFVGSFKQTLTHNRGADCYWNWRKFSVTFFQVIQC